MSGPTGLHSAVSAVLQFGSQNTHSISFTGGTECIAAS